MTARYPVPEWLNVESRAHVEAALDALIVRYRRSLLGVILFGSVARHEERSMRDAHPSDVDLLLIFDRDSEFSLTERLELLGMIGDIDQAHRDNLRELNLMLATQTLVEWDDYFVEQVARDGIVLYVTSSLPKGAKSPRLSSGG